MMWKLRNPFKKQEKNPDKVRAGIASGESRRAKSIERAIENGILDKVPELGILREIGNHFDMEISNTQLIALIPHLEAIKKRMNNPETQTRFDF